MTSAEWYHSWFYKICIHQVIVYTKWKFHLKKYQKPPWILGQISLGFFTLCRESILGFPFVLNVFASFWYGGFVFSDGTVVSKLTTLAYASRADTKHKITISKWNKIVQNEWKSKNAFPDINIQCVKNISYQ